MVFIAGRDASLNQSTLNRPLRLRRKCRKLLLRPVAEEIELSDFLHEPEASAEVPPLSRTGASFRACR